MAHAFKGDKVSTQLIASKSRLAPIKETIQKLELLGNLINLRRLINSVSKDLSFNDIDYWTDSNSHWSGYQQSKKNPKHLLKIECKRYKKSRMFLNGFTAI